MQKALSAAQKRDEKRLDKFLSSLPSGMLGIAAKADQSPHSWLSREINKLRWLDENLSRNCQKGPSSRSSTNKPSSLTKTYTLLVFLPLDPVVQKTTPHPSSLKINILAAIKTQELCTARWAFLFPTESSRSNVINILSNNPVLVKFLDMQFQTSRLLGSVQLETLSMKPSFTDIYSALATPSRHKISITSDKSSRPQNKNFSASPATAPTI